MTTVGFSRSDVISAVLARIHCKITGPQLDLPVVDELGVWVREKAC